MESSLTDRREQRVRKRLHEFPSVLIGFSGGVDSTYLAAIALETLGPDHVLAVTGRSAAYPEVQWRTAVDVASRLGLPHVAIDTHELDDPSYAANPSNRCYFCKTELWRKLGRIARERGIAAVLDGSNADDARDWRPGFRAAAEAAIRSPLLEAGLSKADIRELSRRRELPTWDMPAAPCLSSRIPYGLAVTPERLAQIEQAEAAVRSLGFRVFRVRHHGAAARLEIAAGEMANAVAEAAALVSAMRDAGFERALLDVEGFRSGSLNESLQFVRIGVR